MSSSKEAPKMEKIVAERKHPKTGKVEYLIKWENHTSELNTWHSAKEIRTKAKAAVAEWKERKNRPFLTRKGRGKRKSSCACNGGDCAFVGHNHVKKKAKLESDPFLKECQKLQRQVGLLQQTLEKIKWRHDVSLARQKKNQDKRFREMNARHERRIEKLDKDKQKLLYALHIKNKNSERVEKNLEAERCSSKRAARGKRF